MAIQVELTDTHIKVSFPFNQADVDKIKSVPRARWNQAQGAWLIPFSEASLDVLKSTFPDYQYVHASKQKEDDKRMSELELEELKYIPAVKDVPITDFEFRTKPYWHQALTFRFARNLPCSALFLEQGLGKAKLAIDLATWRFRQKQIRRCLVICPVAVMEQWVEELSIHGHKDFCKHLMLEGSSKKRLSALESLGDFTGFLIINYEGLLPLKDYILRRQLSKDNLFDMMVVDESSKLKHANSQRSKITWKIGTTVKYRNLLSGTPITQSVEDIFSQYRFLQPTVFGPYATAFRSQFLIMGGFENRQVIGYRNVANLMRRIYSLAIRLTKDRCVNLPPKIYERRHAVMDSESSAKYLEFEKKCVAEFNGKTISAQIVLSKLMKLSQITGGFVYEQGQDGERLSTISLQKNPKLDDLADLLDELSGKKIIIWCRFVQELNIVSALLTKRKIKFCSIHGGVKKEDRKTAVHQFQTDNDTQVFVGQIATAGYGITLTKAEVVIYYSNTYSYEERIQSEDRCHRIGLDHSVTYIDLLSVLANGRRTIDHDILDIKDKKERIASEVSMALMQKMVSRCGSNTNCKITGNEELHDEELQ